MTDTPAAPAPATPPAGAPATPPAVVTPPATPPATPAAPAAGGEGAKPNDKPAGAEGTAYTLKLPDGAVLDASAIEQVTTFAKERGLSNEQAQGVLERDNALIATHVQAQQEALEKKQNEWLTTAEADPEIGGAEFPKNAELAKRVVAKFASEPFQKLLLDTKMGNHPEFVRLMLRIGKGMSEDQLVIAGAPSQAQTKSAADLFYPEQGKK